MLRRTILILPVWAVLIAAPAKFPVTDDIQAALDSISADSLRGHVSFLASDLLEGRDTPSRGLDIAAEYIAAQFRRAGLQLAAEDGYFQTANWLQIEQPMEGFELQLEIGEKTVAVGKDKITLQPSRAAALSRAPVVRLNAGDEVKAEQVQDKVVALAPERDQFRALMEMRAKLRALKPAAVLIFSAAGFGRMGPSTRLKDPDDGQPEVPFITVRDAEIVKLFADLKTVTLWLPAPVEKPVKLRNVVGVLPGSDVALKDTYVLVSAHYDHLGMRPDGAGDRIYNGANDDASGTASVIELASALARLKEKPRRTIVFVTFFGEERGLLGSRYYARRPVVPIAKTVADINLEQLGRTDATEGPQINRLTFTGFDYSEVPAILQAAGRETGTDVYQHDKNSDPYFARSDNQVLANMGIPAHTACVAYEYPDYHQAGDEWGKIDYANMAKIDRTLALGLLMIANNPEAPKWNEANAKAERYLKAWKQQHQ